MANPFRWGILSTADISRRLIQAIRQSRNGEVIAVASRELARAERWAAKHAIPQVFGSYEELLRAKVVDGVYLPLPNALHAEWTLRALEAGYPVLCEKPIAANAAEAEQIQTASARTGLLVAEAFMYRFHPMFERVRALIHEGAIGTLSTIFSRFTFLLDDRTVNVASAELAGGALRDVGCYCVNVARLLTGFEPVRVSAFDRRSTVDDTVLALLDFPNGVLAQCETSIANFERHRVELAGTTGTIVLDQPWVPGEGATGFTLHQSGKPTQWLAVPGANAYQLQVEHFVDVVQGRARVRWGMDDAVANMRVLDAIAASAREGRVVEFFSDFEIRTSDLVRGT
jgi:D-xylose 1-dehydrogenase (NADP+, D-xylono-1,5-lactone-forming)